jgi:hypothetical protein
MLANNLVQYVDATGELACGVGAATDYADGCYYVDNLTTGDWFPRPSKLSADRADFRTVGKTVGTDINEADIKCWSNDKKTVLGGSENCWAYDISQDL